MSFSNPFYRYVTGHQPDFAPYHFPTGPIGVAVSPAPPARLLGQGATGAVEGVESRQGRGRAPLDLRPRAEIELQQHGQRESKEGEGSWMGRAGAAQVNSPGSSLGSSNTAFSSPTTGFAFADSTTTRSSTVYQFGQISPSDPVLSMLGVELSARSGARDPTSESADRSPATRPSPRPTSSIIRPHDALQHRALDTSSELLLLQADAQEQAWLSSRLASAEHLNAELQSENARLRTELDRLGRHKEDVDELLGVRSPPETPYGRRTSAPPDGIGMATSDSGDGSLSRSTADEARSTTPRPSAPSAASPSPLSQRTHSSNPRLLVLQDLLEDLNIAEMTIRRLQGELEQRDAALYAREADLQQLREEKVRLLGQLFDHL